MEYEIIMGFISGVMATLILVLLQYKEQKKLKYQLKIRSDIVNKRKADTDGEAK